MGRTVVEVAASTDFVRQQVDVRATPHNKGLVMSLSVTVYDSGLVQFGDCPLGGSDEAWFEAGDLLQAALAEFRRKAVKRKESRES